MSDSLKNTLSFIVYLPLIIVCLSVLGSIGYGIYTYRTTGNFPPSWVTAGRIFLYILKQILYTLKLLGQFLWWLVPIFPDRYRAPNGFTPYGAWDGVNIAKTVPLLSFITFLTISILIFQYGVPSTVAAYSQVINITVLSGLIISILGLFFVFNKQIISGAAGISPMPNDTQPNAQFNWLFQNTSKYLFLSIAVGLALAILVLFIRFGLQNTLFSVTGTTFVMIAAGLMGLTMVYYMLKSNPAFMNVINSSMSMSGLFYAFFILPCIFFEATRYLYNHFRHTPRFAYLILGLEIILIALYFVIPILVQKFYTLTTGKDNKSIIIQNKINSAVKDGIILDERIAQILRYDAGRGPLSSSQWKTIITKYYNSTDNEEELIKWLTDSGYKTKKMCNDDNNISNKFDCERKLKNMVKFIQENTGELVTLREKKKNNECMTSKTREQTDANYDKWLSKFNEIRGQTVNAYTLFGGWLPPRRLDDIRILYVTQDKLDVNEYPNQYVKSDNTFYFNSFKNSHKKKPEKFTLNESTFSYIDSNIINQIKQYLNNTPDGKLFTGDLSYAQFRRAYVYISGFSCNAWRHFWESKINIYDGSPINKAKLQRWLSHTAAVAQSNYIADPNNIESSPEKKIE